MATRHIEKKNMVQINLLHRHLTVQLVEHYLHSNHSRQFERHFRCPLDYLKKIPIYNLQKNLVILLL